MSPYLTWPFTLNYLIFVIYLFCHDSGRYEYPLGVGRSGSSVRICFMYLYYQCHLWMISMRVNYLCYICVLWRLCVRCVLLTCAMYVMCAMCVLYLTFIVRYFHRLLLCAFAIYAIYVCLCICDLWVCYLCVLLIHLTGLCVFVLRICT